MSSDNVVHYGTQASDRLKNLHDQLKPSTHSHPFDPLSAEEITVAAGLVKNAHEGRRMQFRYVSMVEPPKEEMIQYLEKEAAGQNPESPSRRAELRYALFEGESGWAYKVFESHVDLASKKVLSTEPIPDGVHESLSFQVMKEALAILLEDQIFKDAVAKLNLPKNCVVEIDPWMYGCDTTDPVPFRLPFLVYARHWSNNHPDGNLYAVPLPIIPVMDVQTMKVIEILPAASGGTEDGLAFHTHPEKAVDHCIANEYLPELQQDGLRTDLKPLQVIQPEGASFTVTGRLIEWQKWRFRVGWNYREGMVLYDVTYAGRRLFYRMSVSDMTVPYGDPRTREGAPIPQGNFPEPQSNYFVLLAYHRKQAFDLGDIGAGFSANNLALGCDCLGHIHYFSGALANALGAGESKDNVVCVHEQDNGIGWKHTNYRTERAAIVRNRMLVLQQIITVANYEYIFAWQFDQAAGIHFETRATGILSTCPIDPGKTSEWGNVVSPGAMAQNHQHIFSLRLDPAMDGWKNSVVQEDVVSLPFSEDRNPFGNAFKVEKKVFERSGFADAAPHKSRVFKIINPSKFNPISGNPVGYKIVPHGAQLILADPQSIVAKRAKFAQHHLWVTKYRDGEFWCGGKFTNQSAEEKGGVQDMADRNDPVQNEDVVVWHSFALTHIPRVEDFPVMPVEIHAVEIKPADFFSQNPALDVPPSTQVFNKSTLFNAGTPTAGPSSADGTACCTGNTR